MGGLFSKNRRQNPRPPPQPLTHAPPPPPPPPLPLPPPPRLPQQPSISLPPPPQPAAFTFPRHPPPPPPPAGYSYSYAQPSYYAPPNPYGPQPPGPYSHPHVCQPHYTHYVGGGGYYNGWGHGTGAGPVAAPGMSVAPAPAFVDHKTAKKVKNDVNVRKDTIRVFVDEQNVDCHLVSFTFDALVDGSITIYYFAKEGANCTFSSVFPEVYKPRRIPFQTGPGQKFCQPSGSGIDLGFFEMDELSKPSPGEDVFPLVICAETGTLPPLLDGQPNERPSTCHAQITQAVLEKNSEGEFKVRVVRQLLWIDEVRYELREIYGISNADEGGFEDSDPGKECVICMTEPKDTAVLPCRHMCMCSECARELRLQSNKCPICRQPIEELIEIKVNNAAA